MTRGKKLSLPIIEPLVMLVAHRGGTGRLARVLSNTGRCLSLVMWGIFFLANSSTCFAADVVLIQGKQPNPVEKETIRKLVGFYGLQLHSLDVGSQDAVKRALSRLRSTD